jgi:hypothetical protein
MALVGPSRVASTERGSLILGGVEERPPSEPAARDAGLRTTFTTSSRADARSRIRTIDQLGVPWAVVISVGEATSGGRMDTESDLGRRIPLIAALPRASSYQFTPAPLSRPTFSA